MHVPGRLEIPGITLFLHDLPPNSSQVNGIVVPSGKRGFSNTVAVLIHAGMFTELPKAKRAHSE